MASKTVVELFDDMDGSRADETVRFALDGVEYEIDLSALNAAALRDTLAVYIGHAHRPARRARRAATESVAIAAERNGRNGTAKSGSAKSGTTKSGTAKPGTAKATDSMTAEIRRLASESAQKVNQARAAAEAEAEPEPLLPDQSGEPVRSAPGQPSVGPVPALAIPFMEAR